MNDSEGVSLGKLKFDRERSLLFTFQKATKTLLCVMPYVRFSLNFCVRSSRIRRWVVEEKERGI